MNDDGFSGFLFGTLVVWLLIFIFSEPNIYPQTIVFAEKRCSSNGGWEKIEEGRNMWATVYCKDGSV